MKCSTSIISLLLLAAAAPAIGTTGADAPAAIHRFALVAGANFGGPDRATLKYAASDAESVARVLVRLGGVAEADRILLDQPGVGELDVAHLGAGEFFGEHSLLTGEDRSATVMSEGGCVVLRLSKESVAPILQQDPQIAETLSRALVTRQAESLADRVFVWPQ